MNLQYRGSGRVFLKDKEMPCDLYYNEKEGGILLIIKSKHGKIMGDFLELPLEIPYVCGQLDDGFNFALVHLGNRRTNDTILSGITEYHFLAEYLLCGVGRTLNQEQLFKRIDFTISDIVEWGGESVYSIGEKYELTRKEGAVQKTIYEGDEYSISYRVEGSLLPVADYQIQKEHIELEQNGIIEIDFKQEKKLEQFLEIFNRIKRLIEIALLRKVNIEKMEGYSNSIVDKVAEHTIERGIEIYGIGVAEGKPLQREEPWRWKWLSFSDLIEKHSFEHYFDKGEKLAPIVELLLEPLYVSRSSHSRVFLNVVQALETYHSRFVTNDLDEFKERVENLLKSRSGFDIEGERDFFMKSSKKFITLESRLADLLTAEWKIYFDTGEILRCDFPAVIAHTRNYYIHYDERIKKRDRVLSEEELPIYTRALLQILEYYIWLELGFTEENYKIKKKLMERWGNISDELQIINMSEKLHTSKE